jgi:hypothetical protein
MALSETADGLQNNKSEKSGFREFFFSRQPCALGKTADGLRKTNSEKKKF